jgi:siroheme synthase
MLVRIQSFLESMRLHRCVELHTGHPLILDFTMHELYPLLEPGVEVEVIETVPVVHSVVIARLSY